ncbi:MAG: tRNA (adenosine(37)-N6)-threonylcarbamoyltransferase complex dimerization subunit type 1 TsaB [Desulfobacca sp.]
MLVLAFDTSTSRGSLALVADNRLLAEYTLESPASYLNRLLVGIEQLFVDTGRTLQEVGLLVVSAGPGNFTGLRLGLATAKGLALALDCPLVAVNTLDALAANFPWSALPVAAILDAKKQEVYAALYHCHNGTAIRQGDYLLLQPAALAAALQTATILTGPGLERYGALFQELLGAKAVLPPPELRLVRASVLARLGLAHLEAGQVPNLDCLTPFYLRPADAEIKRLAAAAVEQP